ncbi:hypothetical protein CQS04_00455 [Chryseomicrobium excrementi]|uniref:YtpI-like protein n=1 Tax=Chryseomicrobium excrementi TaxID=2041346 RepID=A0A2M9F1Q2_9BACL|nr:YtpI family protein [Chryseomicrobium excrementi]PJK17388.1 hypothetical protein CQS04_00455 [Chryseomicrobium excrementi]
MNSILVIGIIISIVWYFYFKTKQFRTDLPIRKKWYAAKSGICLGAFVFLFGLNYLFLFPDTITYIVAAVFLVLGGYMAVHNYKASKHYGKFVQEEWDLNQVPE